MNQAMLPGVEVEVEVGDSSDVELTPPEVFEPVLRGLEIDAFDFDPCSNPHALVPALTRIYPPQDGLSWAWPDHGICWLNPPYSDPLPWLARVDRWAGKHRDACAVALLKLDPTTRWWQRHVESASALGIVLLRDRVRHIKPGRAKNEVAPFASVLVAFGDNCSPVDEMLHALDNVLGKAVWW